MAMAIRMARAGGPEVLRVVDREAAPPGPGEARLRQTAIGVNFIDVYHRRGDYPPPPDGIIGVEAAGIVAAVGDGVTQVAPGMRVAYAGPPAGAYAGERTVPALPFVATKFGIRRAPGDYARRIDNSPGWIRAAVEASLTRLGRERIDLYYVHRVEDDRPIEETMAVLGALAGEGKIAAIGLSEVSPATLRRAHAVHPVAAVQSEYSLSTRDVEAGVLPVARELGVAFVACSPLGRGLLSGTVDRAALAADDLALLDRSYPVGAFTGERYAAEGMKGVNG